MENKLSETQANLCVFCGSRMGKDPSIVEAGKRLGRKLAAAEIGLVYGGGHVGIMGVIADAVLKEQGQVLGVIPQSLVDFEVAHSEVTNLVVVDTMHERKYKMYEASDAFLVFPGGIGTLDEFFEIWTWRQLGYHDKPIYIYNHKGFFTPLLNHLEHIVNEGFFSANDYAQIVVEADFDSLWGQILGCLPQGRDPNT